MGQEHVNIYFCFPKRDVQAWTANATQYYDTGTRNPSRDPGVALHVNKPVSQIRFQATLSMLACMADKVLCHAARSGF